MLFRQLEYFCAIARTGSYRRAAEELFVSQSAISQQVKALEQEYGQPLTKRSGRGFELTDAGRYLAGKAQGVLQDVRQLDFDMRNFGNDPGELRVGYLNRYVGWEVQAAVAAFSRRHPDVDVTAEPGTHDGLYFSALDGKLDILVNDRRRSLSDDWENHLLFRGWDYVEVSEGSALSWKERVTVGDLRDEACILIAPASQNQRDSEANYYRDVLGYACDFVFAENAEQARMMVAANRGVLPVETREGSARSGQVLRRIPLVDATGAHRYHEYYAFWPKARSNAAIEEFADILQDLFSEAVA